MADDRLRDERTILSAELFAIGSELTTGDTRDTNGGDLAADLALAGVTVRRIAALPDDLALVTETIRAALAAVDLVVTTGGLGPTPDDLTREAVSAALGEEPTVDPELEAHLRGLFRRRGMALPEINLKQAWLIPSAVSLPNPNGTAPGWWVEPPEGGIAVLLPGPPREMRPMWRDHVLPRLRERGLGDGRLVRTLRTYGIGESHVAERLGEAMLRAANPIVATYARAEWLDVRITAIDERAPDGRIERTAEALLEATTKRVREHLDGFVLAEGDTSWADLVGRAAAKAGVRFATAEWGTRGALADLLADVPALTSSMVTGPGVDLDPSTAPLESLAAGARSGGRDVAGPGDAGVGAAGPADDGTPQVGMALVARTGDRDTHLRVAVAGPALDATRVLELRLFQHGPHGRLRAGVAAAAFLVEILTEIAAAAGTAVPLPASGADDGVADGDDHG